MTYIYVIISNNSNYNIKTKLYLDVFKARIQLLHQGIYGHVSAAKKDVLHSSVLFTGTANLPFSTPCISVTTKPICTTFTYYTL